MDVQEYSERLEKALSEAANVAADEIREDCGESIAQRVFHAVKALARAALHTGEGVEGG